MKYSSKAGISVILLTAGTILTGCSNIILHPITNKDILRIPVGTVPNFPEPVDLGYGDPVISVTRDEPGYIISEDYMKRVMKVKLEK